MRAWLLLTLCAGAIVGTAAGGALALTNSLEGDEDAPPASLVDVQVCPGADGSIGQVRRGSLVLVTAVGPDAAFYEINYPLSPNGRAWVAAGEVELREGAPSLPTRNCAAILPSTKPAPEVRATALPTATAVITGGKSQE